MYRGTVPWFKVVHRNRDEFEVWHAQATPSDGWQEMGCCGTVDDCWDYIDAQGEETGLLFRIQDT